MKIKVVNGYAWIPVKCGKVLCPYLERYVPLSSCYKCDAGISKDEVSCYVLNSQYNNGVTDIDYGEIDIQVNATDKAFDEFVEEEVTRNLKCQINEQGDPNE